MGQASDGDWFWEDWNACLMLVGVGGGVQALGAVAAECSLKHWTQATISARFRFSVFFRHGSKPELMNSLYRDTRPYR
jgi:hypothetical protein